MDNQRSTPQPFSSSLPNRINHKHDSITASQLLSSIKTHPNFRTGHLKLDQTISNSSTQPGISRRQHLQFEGPPGIGKTKLSIGIVTRARLSSLNSNSSEEVEVLYIDADGSAPSSLFELSIKALIQTTSPELFERVSNGIHLVRLTSTSELSFFFIRLPRWLEEHPKTKLIVLDSITAHTKYVSMGISERALVAGYIRDSIKQATSSFNCTVIMTTQLTKSDQSTLITPQFKPGTDWSTSTRLTRVLMKFEIDGSRKAILIEDDRSGSHRTKLPPSVKSEVIFGIDDIGIYDPTVCSPSQL